MRRKRLTAEERAIVRHRRFKAFGVDASVGELALCIALFCIADASDVPERVSELAAEGVAFVLREPQRFMDGVGEAVACESEVWEHHGSGTMNLCCVLKTSASIPARSCALLNRFSTVDLNALKLFGLILLMPWAYML